MAESVRRDRTKRAIVAQRLRNGQKNNKPNEKSKTDRPQHFASYGPKAHRRNPLKKKAHVAHQMSDRPAINEHVSKARTHPSTGTRENNGEAPPTGKRP
ncbi:hypothetical protein YC2023_118113 [Brassica napus]